MVYDWLRMFLLTQEDYDVIPLANIAKECLKDEHILKEFWDQDFKQEDGLYKLLVQLFNYFPYMNEELVSLFEILIGNDNADN